MVEESQAADHRISFRSVGPWVEARNGAAAGDKAVAERVGNDPAGGSDVVVCAAIANKEERFGEEESLIELVGRFGMEIHAL